MDDNELNAKFAHIAADMLSLRADLQAIKTVISSLIKTHPDKKALAQNYALVSENTIAHTLGTPYPEHFAEALRKAHERWRARLDKIAQGQDQDQDNQH